jgi:hypothetical protein
MKLCLIEPCVHRGQRVVQVSKLSEVSSRGEAEEPRGSQDGPQCEAFGGLVDLATQPAADGRSEGVGSVGGRLRLAS